MATLGASQAVILSTGRRGVYTRVDDPPERHSRLLVLDGIRAIAIVMVIAGHVELKSNFAFGWMTGQCGVSLFLVLSGYLITRVMLSDERRSGRLRVARFYMRRALRILPAFYVFLGVLALCAAARIIPQIPKESLLASLLYARNFFGGDWDTGHLWSLALEEQFYLFWPVLFVLTGKFRLSAALLLVALLTAFRGYWLFHHATVPIAAVYDLFHSKPQFRMDTFLMGAAFAIREFKSLLAIPAPFFLCAFAVWSFATASFAATLPFETPVAAFLLGAFIQSVVCRPAALARFLSRPIPVFLGVISYSIYLWQQPFLWPSSALRWWTLPAIAVCALASYYAVERPFLKLKDRLR